MQSRGIQATYLSVELNTHTERVDEDTHQDTSHKVLALNDLLHLLCQHTQAPKPVASLLYFMPLHLAFALRVRVGIGVIGGGGVGGVAPLVF